MGHNFLSSRDMIFGDIQKSLGRNDASPVLPRPPIMPPRIPGTRDQEIEKLLQEISVLKGNGWRIAPNQVGEALSGLVHIESVRKAVLWDTPRIAQLGIPNKLRELGIEIIPHDASKQVMAEADLGVTEADFLLAETGTFGLLSSPDQPRSISLLPRVHLAIVHPNALRADLHQVFAEAKSKNYLILITGPSRTSDIELVVTIGVHGPQVIYVWVVDD